jgi:hypothetical protein
LIFVSSSLIASKPGIPPNNRYSLNCFLMNSPSNFILSISLRYCNTSLNENGYKLILIYLPARRVANSFDNSFELDPVM